MGKIAVYLVKWLLKNSQLSLENRIVLTAALLDKLNFIPAKDIIKTNQLGRLEINGREVTLEYAGQLRESAKRDLESLSRKIVNEQVAFRAVTLGIHNGDTLEKLIWSRVALWWAQEQEDLLKLLAGVDNSSENQ